MRLSSLDMKLSEVLSPLVNLGAVLRVAPFVNTLSFGFHYVLAHGSASLPPDRVDLADWNRVADVSKHLDGIFMFYNTKEVAQQFRMMADIPGSFYSEPVTRFRQRFVFLRRNPRTENLAKATYGKFSAHFFEEATAQGLSFSIYTDIRAQARELVNVALLGGGVCPRWIGPGLPLMRAGGEEDLLLFVYSAPCIAYMLGKSHVYISLEVEESEMASLPHFDTHLIWHVPEGRTLLNQEIRACVRAYHQHLFEATHSTNDSEFQAMATACSDTLAARHPGFKAEIFADPKTFRTCLRDHHADPPN